MIIVAGISTAAVAAFALRGGAGIGVDDKQLDTRVAQCVAELEAAGPAEDFSIPLNLLRQDVETFRTLQERLAARGASPSANRPSDSADIARDTVQDAVFSILFGLRGLFPVEEYPMALYGLEDSLGVRDFPPPAGHGRAHLVRQSAFARALFRRAPEAGKAGHDFVAPINALNAMTSLDGFAPHDATVAQMLPFMEQAMGAYPPFEAHLSDAVSSPEFRRIYLEEAHDACRQSILDPDPI